ncbi:hypothetical protein F4778DRAFT_798545 [Xylariomycetidae sp. FL2044]|nr:hypothetical protein F4778DRAFT_798545 [Xylariomycetidae sp. FL2044]
MFAMARDKTKDDDPKTEVVVEEQQQQPKKKDKKHARHKSVATLALMEAKRRASEDYHKAQRAEEAYLTQKHMSRARQSYDETRAHFREGFSHLGQGFRGLLGVLGALPYVLKDRRHRRRKRSEAKKRQRAEEQRRKLEEKLARDYDNEGVPDDDDDGDGGGEEGEEDKKMMEKKMKMKMKKDGKK